MMSLTLFLYSTFNIFIWLSDNYKTAKLDKVLKESTNSDSIEASYWNDMDTDYLEVDLKSLKLQNPYTVGWIKVNGTDIDYPVVQYNDNEFYLTHSFDNSKNQAGWIFSDYRNNLNNLKFNSIIYGHRRKDGSMFGTLKNVLTDEWYQDVNNHIIKLTTEKEYYIFQIFSVYTIYNENYYITTTFKNLELYQEFLNTIKNRSMLDFNIDLNTDDRILTLSTCFDSNGNRLVVHSKLIKKGIHN